MSRRNAQFSALARLRLVALMSVREALHLRILPLFLLVALLPVAAIGWLREFNFGTTEWKFIIDFGHGALGAGGLVLAILATVHLTLGDLERGSVQMLLTRALTPTEFLVGKLVGLLALLTWFAVGLALVLLGVLWWRGGRADIPWTTAFGGIAFIWLKLAVTVALTLLICSYARSVLFATGAAFLLVVLAHLRHLVGSDVGLIQTMLVGVPDFQLFDPERLTMVPFAARPMVASGTAVYAAVYVVLYTSMAGWLLRRREY